MSWPLIAFVWLGLSFVAMLLWIVFIGPSLRGQDQSNWEDDDYG